MRVQNVLILAVALCANLALAQGRPEPMFPGGPRLAAELGLSPEQATAVESIMQSAREKIRLVRENTRTELARVLTPEQLARLDAMGQRRGERAPRPKSGG